MSAEAFTIALTAILILHTNKNVVINSPLFTTLVEHVCGNGEEKCIYVEIEGRSA